MTSISLSTYRDTCYVPIFLTTAYHPAILYYDYTLTFDREFRLFWSRRSIEQWGSVLFFVNRYCGIIGHVPVIVQMFARPESALYRLCKPEYLYHEILAVVMQTVIGCMSHCIAIISYIRGERAYP